MNGIYEVKKDGKDLGSIYFGTVISSMHTPIVPTTTRADGSVHYKKFNSDFNLLANEDKTIIMGEISSDLIKRLKEYNLELIKCEKETNGKTKSM